MTLARDRGRGSRGRERDSDGSDGERCEEGMADTHLGIPFQEGQVCQPVPDVEVIWTATHCTGTEPV